LARGLAIDDGYCRQLNDNLFQPLSACTRRELERGDGAELGGFGRRGKLQALHSSAALACNVFDYWRGRDLAVLQAAFGINGQLCGLAFEQKFPTGLPGKSPNLDVVLYSARGEHVAVESKFTEPYGPKPKRHPFRAAYFPEKHGLWADRGLRACQVLAKGIQGGSVSYQHLDAPQLLKHVLGLALAGEHWRLLYLWYDAGGEAGAAHAAEVADFLGRAAGDPVAFSSLSYQVLFCTMQPGLIGPHRAYGEYLAERYFPAVAT
jgi:hypothetical protein